MIKKTMEKARELRPRLENVFEDDVHLMVQLFNQFQETGGLKSLQVHHSREDWWLQWQVSLMQRENVVPLRADEYPGESSGYTGCYMDDFKCDFECVRVWDSGRYTER